MKYWAIINIILDYHPLPIPFFTLLKTFILIFFPIKANFFKIDSILTNFNKKKSLNCHVNIIFVTGNRNNDTGGTIS